MVGRRCPHINLWYLRIYYLMWQRYFISMVKVIDIWILFCNLDWPNVIIKVLQWKTQTETQKFEHDLFLALKMKKRATNQRNQVVTSYWKCSGKMFSPKSSIRNVAFLVSWFDPSKAYIRFLTSRTEIIILCCLSH